MMAWLRRLGFVALLLAAGCASAPPVPYIDQMRAPKVRDLTQGTPVDELVRVFCPDMPNAPPLVEDTRTARLRGYECETNYWPQTFNAALTRRVARERRVPIKPEPAALARFEAYSRGEGLRGRVYLALPKRFHLDGRPMSPTSGDDFQRAIDSGRTPDWRILTKALGFAPTVIEEPNIPDCDADCIVFLEAPGVRLSGVYRPASVFGSRGGYPARDLLRRQQDLGALSLTGLGGALVYTNDRRRLVLCTLYVAQEDRYAPSSDPPSGLSLLSLNRCLAAVAGLLCDTYCWSSEGKSRAMRAIGLPTDEWRRRFGLPTEF